MIDVNKVMSVAERAIYIGAGKEQLFTADEIQSLSLMLREAERDAERYRWLCEQAWFQVESEWQLILGETETEDDFIICANEKIDQAMKEKGDE